VSKVNEVSYNLFWREFQKTSTIHTFCYDQFDITIITLRHLFYKLTTILLDTHVSDTIYVWIHIWDCMVNMGCHAKISWACETKGTSSCRKYMWNEY
jgi:hypothetical protein